MKGTKTFIWILTIMILIPLSVLFYKKYSNIQTQPEEIKPFTEDIIITEDGFSDGLGEPDSIINYPVEEFEPGPAKKFVYHIDINNDGEPDKISKTFIETFNAHSYYTYQIELKIGNKYKDITPEGLHTSSGADCDLRLVKFDFKPNFRITIISREFGDSYADTAMATKQTFNISNNKIEETNKIKLREVCDVKELF